MREVIWIRRLAFIGAHPVFRRRGARRLHAPVEFRARLPGLAGLLRAHRAHGQRGALRERRRRAQGVGRDDPSLLREHAGPHHRRDRRAVDPRAARARRERGVRAGAAGAGGAAGHARHAHRHLAAQAADRHRPPGRRTNYLRAAVVAVAVDARRRRGRWTATPCSPATGWSKAAARARLWAGLALAALALQVALGGWTSSNYAARRLPGCAEVPGPVDPRGGLPGRLRAVARPRHQLRRRRARSSRRAWPSISRIAWAPWWPRSCCCSRRSAHSAAWAPGRAGPALAVLAALAAQISIGVFMVLRAFPLELAAAHNAGAALLVGATVLLNRKLRPVADFR